jgi:sulfhydrogenase subunit beta (sulfur reductase)
MSKEVFITTRSSLLAGLNQAIRDQYQLVGPTKKEGKNLYDYIKKSEELVFDYQPTVLSPKKFFFPVKEDLLKYTHDGKVQAVIEAKPLVLFGIRPCDLNGIKIMNEAFAEGNGDPNYLAKLEKTVVIGIDCKKVCDPDAFCFKVKSHHAKAGFDLMLFEKGDQYLVELATAKGKEFAKKYLKLEKADEKDLTAFLNEKEKSFGQEKPFKNLEKFPEIFEKNKTHKVWDEEGSRCLSCGSCIMVCPTCYCFDVNDEWELSLKKGARSRKWDACMLSSFAVVAGGENFRHSATKRLHHRINRKFDYLMKKHGQSVCVGCGRCVRACLAEISPKVIAEKITEA